MKKLLLVLFALCVTVFVLAFSASAACTHEDKDNVSINYQDYTQKGTMTFTCNGCNATSVELAPLVEFNGYSTSVDEDGICAGYKVNVDALKEIKNINSDFELGLVAASKNLLGDSLPLDPNTAEPTDLSQYGAYVLKSDISSYYPPYADLKIQGFSSTDYLEPLYITAYAFDGSKVVYLKETQQSSELPTVAFVEASGKVDVTIDGMKYSIYEETTLSADRVKQIANSNSTYNKGTSMSSWKLSVVQIEAYAIVTGGAALGYSNAADFMNHFLSNTGKQYNLDLNKFFTDSTALSNRNAHINAILRAGEALAIENNYVTVNATAERINHNLGGDWYYSLGSYFDDVDLENLTVTEIDGEMVYSATVKYSVIDFYNWNEGSTNGFLNGSGPSQYQLYQLHRAGKAREFLTYGEISYEITWTKGQTVDQIASFN